MGQPHVVENMCKANKPILANRINHKMSCHILDKKNFNVNKVDDNCKFYGNVNILQKDCGKKLVE